MVKDMSGSFKMKIDYRDGQRCGICGAGWDKTHISRHHITPRSEGGLHQLGNVITLCKMHHKWADEGRIDRIILFTIAEERNRALGWKGYGEVKRRRWKKERARARKDPKRYHNNRHRTNRRQAVD